MNNSTSKKNIIDYVSKVQLSHQQNTSLLTSSHWQCHDDIGNDGEWVEDVDSIFEGLSATVKLTLKISMIELGTFRIQDNTVLTKRHTFVLYSSLIRWLSKELTAFNIDRLSDLTKDQMYIIYRSLTKRSLLSRNNSRVINNPINFKTVQTRAIVLEKICINYQLGLMPDGFAHYFTESQYLKILKPNVIVYVDWKDWLKGGTLGNFPLEYTLVLLTFSINTIRSKKVALLLAIQQAFDKTILVNDYNMSFAVRGDKLTKKLRQFSTYNYRDNTTGSERINKSQDGFHKLVYDLSDDKNIKDYVFPGLREYNNTRNDAAYSCLMIIIITSGIRASELLSLNRDSFKLDSIGNVSFVSEIKKTNHSISTERPITGIALEAYNLLLRLNMKKNILPSDPLFDIETIPSRLLILTRQSSYQAWVKRVLDKKIKYYNSDNHPNPTPHRFRHTWAELALRRFDGNVHEAVRSHFRHAVGSWMTMSYLKNKYHEDVEKISKEYISELIGRAATGKESLFGPVGRYIIDKLRDIKAVTAEDIEDLIEEFDIIDPHEYGYCMIRKVDRAKAKCFDRKTQSPIYNQAKFELCGSCIGSLRLANHRDTIVRIGMAAQEHARVFDELGYSAITNLSKKTIHQCEAALRDFKELEPINIKFNKDES